MDMLSEVWERLKAQNRDQRIRPAKSPHSGMMKGFRKSLLRRGGPELLVGINLGFSSEAAEADGVLREDGALRILEFKLGHDEVDRGIGQLLRYKTLFLQRYGGSVDTIKLGLVCGEITQSQHAACCYVDIKLWCSRVIEYCSINDLHLQYPDASPFDVWLAEDEFSVGDTRRRAWYMPGLVTKVPVQRPHTGERWDPIPQPPPPAVPSRNVERPSQGVQLGFPLFVFGPDRWPSFCMRGQVWLSQRSPGED